MSENLILVSSLDIDLEVAWGRARIVFKFLLGLNRCFSFIGLCSAENTKFISVLSVRKFSPKK